MTHQTILEQIADIKGSPSGQHCHCPVLKTAIFSQSIRPLQTRLLNCIRSGLDNPDSDMGCYANHPTDYDDLHPFFSKLLSRHHGVDENTVHHSDWNLPDTHQQRELSTGPLSMRIRVGRNLKGFPLPAAMTQDDRISLEGLMVGVFRQLQRSNGFEGKYHSLTPDHANNIDMATYQTLVRRHLMFKDMDGDRYLKSAGISAHWPHGRGCYLSNDEKFIIWVGEEDHLRIMVMDTGKNLAAVFNRLKLGLSAVAQTELALWAQSPDFGYVTSCPTNIGTAMRASVIIFPCPI